MRASRSGTEGCPYEFLGAGSLTQFQAQSLHDEDMFDFDTPTAQSLRYEQRNSPEWEWGAEGALCPTDDVGQLHDFSSLYTFMGGWGNGAYAPGSDSCLNRADQEFAFFPIDNPYFQAYHSALWHDDKLDADATHIVVFINDGATVTWPVDGGGAAADIMIGSRDKVWGDVLDGPDYVHVQDGFTGHMLVRWRAQGDGTEFSCNADANSPQPCFYEKLRFALDNKNKTGLKLAWGKRTTNFQDAETDKPDASLPCNGTSVTCYTHCL